MNHGGVLGLQTSYPTQYDASILFPIERQLGRSTLSLQPPPTWYGADIWYAYEVSWLDPMGKPIVAIAQYIFDQSNPKLIESKSFKLYLNSFNNTMFESVEVVQKTMEDDLSKASQGSVQVTLTLSADFDRFSLKSPEGLCIDTLPIAITQYTPCATLLKTEDVLVEETLISHTLRTNCPVTGQPDWGTIQIHYKGKKIQHESLLTYIISFRNHTGFHEQCVEEIFCDITQYCQPELLTVYAQYTRRGGLDINPWRSTEPQPNIMTSQRHARQ
ncbi:MAG: NADPH-dependent 7-cyano-7-deazaguanine reductase QueF [Alcaligenaceae bacterium]|nr:NADPH-dependent 7-cyano-7-deazaguanine reductase QueF [Alcaligenaceae bacterium]